MNLVYEKYADLLLSNTDPLNQMDDRQVNFRLIEKTACIKAVKNETLTPYAGLTIAYPADVDNQQLIDIYCRLSDCLLWRNILHDGITPIECITAPQTEFMLDSITLAAHEVVSLFPSGEKLYLVRGSENIRGNIRTAVVAAFILDAFFDMIISGEFTEEQFIPTLRLLLRRKGILVTEFEVTKERLVIRIQRDWWSYAFKLCFNEKKIDVCASGQLDLFKLMVGCGITYRSIWPVSFYEDD